MYAFQYHRPETLSAAKELFKQKDDPFYLAGGHTLIPSMKQRLASPSDLIDISGIAELYGVKAADKNIVIGSMTRHGDVADSEEIRNKIPGLAELAGSIGDAQVRSRGTIGGSIANNDPSADYPAAILGLGAVIYTDSRTIKGDEFITGMFETSLDEGELITKLEFPVPDQSVYVKFDNAASRYAVVGIFISVIRGQVRIGVTGAAPSAFRLTEYEKALTASFSVEAIRDLKVDSSNLNLDLHASAEYRAHLTHVMTRRAVESLAG